MEFQPSSNRKVAVVGGGPTGVALSNSLILMGFTVDLIEAGGIDSEGDELSLSSYQFDTTSLMPENVHRLGGGSNYWFGRIGEFLPLDFEELGRVRPQAFPIEFENISPFYSQAFEMLTGKRELDSELVQSESARLGIKMPKNLDLRIIRHANLSFVQDLLKTLREDPRFRLLLNQRCIEIKKAYSAEGVESYTLVSRIHDNIVTENYELVILCCGALQSPTLILNSPDLLTLLNPKVVGAFLMEHIDGFAGEISWSRSKHSKILKQIKLNHRRELFDSDGLGVGIKISETLRSQNLSLNLQLEVVPRQRRYIFDPAVRTKWLHIFRLLYFSERVIRKTIAEIVNTIVSVFGRATFSVWVKSEILPNPESKISIFNDGLKIKTRYKHIVSEKSKSEFIRALKILGDELSLARVGDLRIKRSILDGTDQLLQGLNWHPMGTLRMGLDPEQSVCDSDLRLRSAERIYVADASVFPSGSNANPTFTALALGIRLASHLEKKYKA